MNKIYIVNDYYQNFIELNFQELTFTLFNVNYSFEYISIDKIKIYWLRDEYEIYYTEDSFVYYSDIKNKNKIKMIYITNNNWYDQGIINYYNKTILRLKYNNEYGQIKYNNNYLKIDWEKWGREIFYGKNDIYYFKDSITLTHDINNKKRYIHIFIHVCCIENWIEILTEQLNLIKNTGLYDIIEKIHFGILGELSNIQLNIFNDPKYEILYIDKNIYLYEVHTINNIKLFCENYNMEEVYILYIHTKGVRRAGNDIIIKSWRNMMEYFLIEKYKECLSNLDNYDTLGNNVINSRCVLPEKASINTKHFFHYSGNFWWSKKSYIDKLKYLPVDYSINSSTRFKSENWILSNYPNCNVGYIFQDNTNTHPYYRYVFDTYKEYPFYVKKLNDNI